MYFIILAEDKADHLQVRMDYRSAHLDYLDAMGCVVVGGPLLSDNMGTKPLGSMLIINVASMIQAEAFVEGDPYGLAGLFDKVEIRPWTPTVGSWRPEGI